MKNGWPNCSKKLSKSTIGSHGRVFWDFGRFWKYVFFYKLADWQISAPNSKNHKFWLTNWLRTVILWRGRRPRRRAGEEKELGFWRLHVFAFGLSTPHPEGRRITISKGYRLCRRPLEYLVLMSFFVVERIYRSSFDNEWVCGFVFWAFGSMGSCVCVCVLCLHLFVCVCMAMCLRICEFVGFGRVVVALIFILGGECLWVVCLRVCRFACLCICVSVGV